MGRWFASLPDAEENSKTATDRTDKTDKSPPDGVLSVLAASPVSMQDFEPHRFATLFPPLGDNDLKSLASNILANGLLEPITLFESKILDGWNRYCACLQVGVEPEFRDFDGVDPLAFVISKNLTRRHLDDGQRAMVAAKIATLGEGRPSKTASIEAVSQSEAADMLNVSRSGVQRAVQVREHGIPELIEAAERGEIAVSAAEEIARLPEEEQRSRLPSVAHNSGDFEWISPPDIVERAREVLGGIDCDPASSAAANEIIKAKTYYTKETDGLTQPWHGRAWMNPPFATKLIEPLTQTFLDKFARNEITAGIILTNNTTETDWCQPVMERCSAICFPDGRQGFWKWKDGQFECPKGKSLQGQAIFYFGGNVKRFCEVFRPIGVVLAPLDGT